MTFIQIIAATLVPEAERLSFVDQLFGINYVLRLEPAIWDMAGNLAAEYNGGYWEFMSLSNGGFYMRPRADTIFDVRCENGFVGKLSADALGIAATLYAYSNLSFDGEGTFPERCANQFHQLREFIFEHAEARGILAATD